MNSTLTEPQLAKISLWYQVNASLSAYNKLIKAFFNAQNALAASVTEWQALKIHAKHLARHSDLNSNAKFLEKTIGDLQQAKYQLLFQDEAAYPQQLNQLFDPPPLLFVRGNINRLHEAQIAIVGSRKPTQHAQKITFDMAQYLAQAGYIVTSGLAQGVDYQAHLGALTQPATQAQAQATIQTDTLSLGRTVGVMGTGIDVCYPKHHTQLFAQIIDAGGCLVSELLPQTPANKHTFPRRNRIVAGLSLGTIVTEATINSGSLITARLTSEQGKQVFAVPSHIDNKNAEGCHHLIREGATLIYHPEQVLEDIKYQQIQPKLVHIAADTSAKQTDKLAVEPILNCQNSDQGHSQDCNQNLEQVDTSAQLMARTTATTTQTAEPITAAQSAKKQQTILPLANTELSAELTKLFAQIDWTGVDLDKLIRLLQLDTQTILVQLMELELMGLIRQEGGRYVRV